MDDDNSIDIEAVKAFAQKAFAERQSQFARWGEQGPPVNAVVKGQRLVASYNRIIAIPEDATYHDFLGSYIKHALGEQWWAEQANLPQDKAHQLIHWQRKVRNFQLSHSSSTGINSAPGKGVVGHYFRLAFDLHTLHHQGLVQERLIGRLRNRGNFQGARYETAVCAAFVRAGFKVELQDESTSPHKVCELVAIHKPTGISYSVEAKSRHIQASLATPNLVHDDQAKNPECRRS